MATFLHYDANGTDGTDLSLMTAVYEIGGRAVRVPANYSQQQIKDYVVTTYGVTPTEYDQLAQLNAFLGSIDLTTITGLSGTSTTPELVAAIQTLAQVVRALTRQTRFLLNQD